MPAMTKRSDATSAAAATLRTVPATVTWFGDILSRCKAAVMGLNTLRSCVPKNSRMFSICLLLSGSPDYLSRQLAIVTVSTTLHKRCVASPPRLA